MREPVTTTLNAEELELVDAAMRRSNCNSRSAFLRSAALVVADFSLRLEERDRDYSDQEGSHADSE